MRKLLITLVAVLASIFGLSLLTVSPSAAQTGSCSAGNITTTNNFEGRVTNCFGFDFIYDLDASPTSGRGLQVEEVRLDDGSGNDTLMIARAAFPGMPVQYESPNPNNCGPYVDQFHRGNPYQGASGVLADFGSNPQTGLQWLELGATHYIGGYVIYTAYYFTNIGEMHMRIFARGFACGTPTDHEHYPMLLLDLDTGPGSYNSAPFPGQNDELYYLSPNGNWVRQNTEADNNAAVTGHLWEVRDPGGDAVRVQYEAQGFQASLANCSPGGANLNCNGQTSYQTIPQSAYADNIIHTRDANYSTDEQRWPGNCTDYCGASGYNGGMWPYRNNESIVDPVIVVRGFLDHDETDPGIGPEDWHTTGVKVYVANTPPVAPTATPVPPTPVPPTAVPPTATPVPGPAGLPFTQSGGIRCTGSTQNSWVNWTSPVINTGGVPVDVSTLVTGTGDMEATNPNQDTARLQYRLGNGSWQFISSLNGNPAGGTGTLSGTSIANNGSIQFQLGGYVSYANDEEYCFRDLQVSSAAAVPTPTPVPPTAVPATPIPPTPTSIPPTPVPPGGCVLADEVAQPKSAGSGGAVTCTIVVPAGATSLNVDISGGQAEADLYVQYGSAPATAQLVTSANPSASTATYCSVWEDGNTESCSFTNPAAGTWYVTVADYNNLGFSGVQLVADYETAGGPVPTSTPVPPVTSPCTNTTWSIPTGSAGATQRCTFVVPSGVSSMTVTMAGPAASATNEADLYVQRGSAPPVITSGTNAINTENATSCTRWDDGNTATCTFTNPQAGTWHLLVADYGSRGFSGINVTTNW